MTLERPYYCRLDDRVNNGLAAVGPGNSASPPRTPETEAPVGLALLAAPHPSSLRLTLGKQDSALHPLLRGTVGPPVVGEPRGQAHYYGLC